MPYFRPSSPRGSAAPLPDRSDVVLTKEPDLKKQKLEEEIADSVSSDDDDIRGIGDSKMEITKDEFLEYARHVDANDGFNMEEFPYSSIHRIIDLTKRAIEIYNGFHKSKYVLESMEGVVVESLDDTRRHFFYDITFRAKLEGGYQRMFEATIYYLPGKAKNEKLGSEPDDYDEIFEPFDYDEIFEPFDYDEIFEPFDYDEIFEPFTYYWPGKVSITQVRLKYDPLVVESLRGSRHRCFFYEISFRAKQENRYTRLFEATIDYLPGKMKNEKLGSEPDDYDEIFEPFTYYWPGTVSINEVRLRYDPRFAPVEFPLPLLDK